MVKESPPTKEHPIPTGGREYKVKTNETLASIARANGISEAELNLYNFGTTNPREINWYLRDRVGCTKATHDGFNWMFTADARRGKGTIYLPPLRPLATGSPDPSSMPSVAGPADIKVIADEIKQAQSSKDNRDVEFLAQLFEDDRIIDKSGTGLPGRLMTILAASADPKNGGVTHFSGIFDGRKDVGFRKEFKDPWPGFSDNQVGHFITAVDIGFQPDRTYALVPWWEKAAIYVGTGNLDQGWVREHLCMRLIIGHEQVADNAPDNLKKTAKSPDETEVFFFEGALRTVTPSLNQDLKSSRSALQGIRVGQGQGNSFQDLHLSLFGYKFGEMIRQGKINNRNVAAQWIRTNLGGP